MEGKLAGQAVSKTIFTCIMSKSDAKELTHNAHGTTQWHFHRAISESRTTIGPDPASPASMHAIPIKSPSSARYLLIKCNNIYITVAPTGSRSIMQGTVQTSYM